MVWRDAAAVGPTVIYPGAVAVARKATWPMPNPKHTKRPIHGIMI